MEFRLRADDGPICGIWILHPHQLNDMKYLKKKRCQSQYFLYPRLLREREKERERTFSHNLDFYVVQTAERVYVIVM